ncbi:hypothetical protein J6590_094202 [Homalodisca vitripennis]|nr:hypothetical protein J6590_025820 [Homalodisca vitripennis]KAG8324372.1 hypothetical protein J6590_094202 [Homalodisca vitripennis]
MDINVDTELFIAAVKNQPVIWDTTSEHYHDRIKKRGAWFIVCEEFFEGFDEKSGKEKNEIGKKLMKRWKNIIDNYKKTERKKDIWTGSFVRKTLSVCTTAVFSATDNRSGTN